jgi:hypothetical protein
MATHLFDAKVSMSVSYRLFIALTLFLSIFTNATLTIAAENANNSDCPSCAVSRSSESISGAGSMVVQGSLLGVTGSAEFVVESSVVVASGVVIVMKGASDAASVTVQLSGEGLRQLGLVSGAILHATAVSTGHILISAGKVIAFIPNEIGKALLHHARVK